MKGKLILGAVGLVLCLALVLGTAIPRSTSPAEANGTVTIGINPSTYNATLSETFTLDIKITITASENVGGVQAYINFDPTKLEVENIAKGPEISAWFEWQSSWDNIAGTIDYTAAAISPTQVVNQTFVLAAIEFRALAVTNSTALNFVTTPGVRETIVSYGGQTVPCGVQNSEVTIVVCTLLGQVGLQGRSATSGPTWETPLTVTLLEPGTTTPVVTYNVTTDSQGNFVVSGMLPGTYDIRVKCSHTPANRKNGVVISGNTTGPIAFGILHEGDANNDNKVDMNDMTLLATSFGKLSGQPGFIDNCNFNRDSLVNINDVTLMAMNFGITGDVIVP